jgi:hypothetical protein
VKAPAADWDSGHAERPPIGYRTQSPDTAYDIERRLVDVWRRMSAGEKARQLLDCCRMVDQLSLAGARLRHPNADDRELFLRTAALRLGRDLMIEVYGWDPDDR